MSELSRQKHLTQLYIFLENSCSLACRNCQARAGVSKNGNGNGNRHILPPDVIAQVVDQAIPLGLQTVRLTGGEPFLYPGFDTIIDHMECQELNVTIETSGRGLTPARAARIAHLPQSRVIIELDGAGPITHDALHNAPGSFEIATQAARLLSAAGLAPHIHFTLTRQNYAQIGATILLTELLGAESIHFSTPQVGYLNMPHSMPHPGNYDNHPALGITDVLSIEELIALTRKVERELAKTTFLRLSVDLPPAFRGLHPLARVEGQGRCPVLNSLAVLPAGEYALCGGAAEVPELLLGRAGNDDLEQIWDTHPTLTNLRESLPGQLEGICGRCIMKTACLGFCAIENYLCSGAFEGPNFFCQYADKVGLFPAGRLIENLLW
jgi:SynChlorMet cassette radical SAM/SPASM protein ScmF